MYNTKECKAERIDSNFVKPTAADGVGMGFFEKKKIGGRCLGFSRTHAPGKVLPIVANGCFAGSDCELTPPVRRCWRLRGSETTETELLLAVNVV